MKGILLAGGRGSRLYPLTCVASKHLLCIYDKPMIYYPLSTLMHVGITEILIISTSHDIPLYQRLLGDGSHLGLKLEYAVQEKPEGIAQAFLIGESFIGNDSVCLILGDNIFYGHAINQVIKPTENHIDGAIVFGCWVKNPEQYGVIEFDGEHNVIGIEEKPKFPKSNFAVPGLYFYDNQVIEIAKNLKASGRGELEITDVNLNYMKRGQLRVKPMGRGITWLDTGTPEGLLDAANFVATIEKRQGLKIACLEEISYRLGYISREDIDKLIDEMPESDYRQYVQQLFKMEHLKAQTIPPSLMEHVKDQIELQNTKNVG
ncbi:MAG: glucose-1-phosphate thymidylyltransferase RfbA [Clostridia bacterium]|nr:glucose-1-phosphate thymidylyltransferase RfbA [Clostridia bacterium]